MSDLGLWTRCRQPKPAARCRLFCFPYAGGHAGTYREWNTLLPPQLELHSVLLPGRIPRMLEAPLFSVADIVHQCTPRLMEIISDGKPFALFGHSMGALLAFAVGRELRRRGRPPNWLFASGRQAPQLPWRRPEIHALGDDGFLDALRRLGGTPEAVLINRELMAAFLPTLRADFTVVETYQYSAEPALSCPVSLFGGLEDQHVTVDDLLAWQDQTEQHALLTMLPGGHFFIEAEAPAIVRTITTDLAYV